MDIFSFFAKPALESQVLQEAAQQASAIEFAAPIAEPDAVDCALLAQASTLRAGFTERQALAAALEVLALERPLISGPKGGRPRRLSQKRARALRQIASSIAVEEQGRAAA